MESLQNDSPDRFLARWVRIGIIAGLLAVISYPLLVFATLPRSVQVLLGATFGPALAVASVALARILQSRRQTPSMELAAVANSLAGALVTVEIMVQLAIHYSTVQQPLDPSVRAHIWDLVLGIDVAFDAFIALGTLLFAVNMLRDPRFGRIIGWIGVLVAVVALYGANIFYFPDPPYTHGFPHVGAITGLWYLAVTVMMIRHLSKLRAATNRGGSGSQ